MFAGRAAVLLAVGVIAWVAPATAQDAGRPDADAVDASAAPADAGPPRTESCPRGSIGCHEADVDFAWRDALFAPIDLDSGWVPAGSPLQLRIAVHFGGETNIAEGGTVATSWPAPLSISLPGRPGTGTFSIDYGFELTITLRFDVTVAGVRYAWEGDIPVPYFPEDLRMAASGTFDPFLLSDTMSTRPVELSDATDRFVAFRYDLAGGLISIPGVGGGFALDLQASLDATYQGTRNVVARGRPITTETGLTVITPDGASPGFGPAEDVTVHPEGTLHRDGVITLFPNLYLSVVGRHFAFDLAEIPLHVVDRTDDVVFDDRVVHVPLPDVRVMPLLVDMGEIPLGRTEERFVAIANDGEAPLEVVASMADLPFSTSTPRLTVPPMSEGRLAVRYMPSAAGSSADTLFLETNDPDAPLVVVRLLGSGLAPPPPPDDAGVPAHADAGRPSGVPDDGGCGCRVSGCATHKTRTAHAATSASASALLLAAALRRARRRRRGSARAPRG